MSLDFDFRNSRSEYWIQSSKRSLKLKAPLPEVSSSFGESNVMISAGTYIQDKLENQELSQNRLYSFFNDITNSKTTLYGEMLWSHMNKPLKHSPTPSPQTHSSVPYRSFFRVKDSTAVWTLDLEAQWLKIWHKHMDGMI